MKKILYLSFYFEPDLSAGSFRNTTLSKELASQVEFMNAEIYVLTTQPNRYDTYHVKAKSKEVVGNLKIERIDIPRHQSGFRDQIFSFYIYYKKALKLVKNEKYDLVFVSSSRLFTAYLGYKIAKNINTPLYVDIRDIFTDTVNDILNISVLKKPIIKVLEHIERKIYSYAKHVNLISEGFNDYFKKFNIENITNFSNGIDDDFINLPPSEMKEKEFFTITYAGNIGKGQGLECIIPQSAKMLGERYRFRIIGDGGQKRKLLDEIIKRGLHNVEMIKPVSRKDVVQLYKNSDFLFIHLNDYNAFKKVLPSKIFELGAYEKPILAGVSGYAREFMQKHIENIILFEPGNPVELTKKIKNYKYKLIYRETFIKKFKRSEINKKMTKSIISYL